jgi:hypothetical protein
MIQTKNTVKDYTILNERRRKYSQSKTYDKIVMIYTKLDAEYLQFLLSNNNKMTIKQQYF